MKLTKAQHRELRLLFAQQDKWQALSDLAKHAVLNESITLSSSKRSKLQITLHDSDLFKLIGEFASRRIEEVEKKLEEVEI